jgi:hypothetical protein
MVVASMSEEAITMMAKTIVKVMMVEGTATGAEASGRKENRSAETPRRNLCTALHLHR